MTVNWAAVGQYEGAFASPVLGRNLQTLAPFASALAGAGAFRAGPGGLLQGRFGFGNAVTGMALNQQTDASDVLGVVIPLRSVNGANGGVIGGPPNLGGWQAARTWQTYDRAFRAWRLRQGIVANLMTVGNFWLKFAGGANYGDTVYCSPLDGSATSGTGLGLIATVWKVCSPASPGGLAMVSSTAYFNN